ncbi:MAG: YggS family pyridoxal phosphate-dependent enzyme [Victivallaceae bacterium]|nr:YggS family pyridoxal phosphate-dependent enzyme [Victivallaceae bacterium]
MSIPDNYRRLTERIAYAARAAGRDPRAVLLLAVSKTADLPQISELYDAGVRHFAESRETELLRKSAALPPDIVWHFIGPLQANKVRKVIRCAQVIHSLDSVDLIRRADRIAAEENRRPRILLEVNVSGEASKGGFTVEETPGAAELAAAAEHLDFDGLMTMAPLNAPEAELTRVFGDLAALRDRLEIALRRPLPTLSMGMSGDFPTAVACGATIVRIGTSLFSEGENTR